MYWSSIIWLISWPVLIYVSYRIIVYAVRRYEGSVKKEE
jgi:hypothetical protein